MRTEVKTIGSIAFFLSAYLFGFTPAAKAESGSFSTSHTVFHESPFHTNMTVYTPTVDVEAKPWEFLDLRAGWEADVVSGASVAVKAGPSYQATHPGVDVVSSASVRDLRNVGRGGFTVRKDTVTLTGSYSYSTEHDYRSHAFDVAARTDLFEHNTNLEIAYARNFDRVCDRVQGVDDLPARYRALEDSSGCFTANALRTTRSFDADSFQGSWTQSWTPTFATQLVYTAQIAAGFQSNPYRSIVLGDGAKAQEHHPENRARHSVALRGNWFLRPLKAALRIGARGYADTWNVKSVTAEVEFEKYFGERLRLMARARYYKQGEAIFWSDDYSGGDRPAGPKGAYFSGDRELSPFSSYLVGARIGYTFVREKGKILGLVTSLRLAGSADAVQFDYQDFRLGSSTIGNARAYIGGASLDALF